MSESLRTIVEIGFNVLYLIAVWFMVYLMTKRLPAVSSENRPVANRFRWAFLLLALGDTGHVGFRVVAYALGGLEQNPLWVGLGALATAITVTFFYVLMLDIWRVRFDQKYGWFEYLLIASVPLRFIVMALPGNNWGSTVPPAFWGPFRNIFLMILGLGVLYLILRDARKAKDNLFRNVAYCIFFSYLFYTPVIFWVRDIPMLGMLMIPKTIMYVAIAFLAYKDLYPQERLVNTQSAAS
ncbi:MAG: hypothetical protein Kow002_17540 [Anaerolineales bacterium]